MCICCCLNSGGKYNRSHWIQFSYGHLHITSSSQASVLRREPDHTLLSSLVHRSRIFSTTTGLFRPSWNQYVCLCVLLKRHNRCRINPTRQHALIFPPAYRSGGQSTQMHYLFTRPRGLPQKTRAKDVWRNIRRTQAAVSVHCRHPVTPSGHTMVSSVAACCVRPGLCIVNGDNIRTRARFLYIAPNRQVSSSIILRLIVRQLSCWQTNWQTTKQTPLKTSTSLRYATPVGNN